MRVTIDVGRTLSAWLAAPRPTRSLLSLAFQLAGLAIAWRAQRHA